MSHFILPKQIPQLIFKHLCLISLIIVTYSTILCSNTFQSSNEPPKSPNINPLEINSEITYSENNYYVISTKDGYLNAYTKSQHPLQLWSIFLGKELITTNIISKSVINERKTLIPMEGKLFILTNTPKVQFEEFTIPITELITRAPFSLGFMPNYYFMGNKTSSQITIDANKGIIVSEEDNVYIGSRINLINVIRLDYTLICLKEKEQIWNTTVSEIIVLAEGSQNELMISGDSGDTVNDFVELVELKKNDIFSVHNYNHLNNIPVKIYDRTNKRPSKDTLLENMAAKDNDDDYNEITDQSQNSFVLNIIQLQNDKNDIIDKRQYIVSKIGYMLREYVYVIILIVITTVLYFSYIIKNRKGKNNTKKITCVLNNDEQRNKNTEDKHDHKEHREHRDHKNYKENNDCDYNNLFNISKNIKDNYSNSCDKLKDFSRKKNLFAEDHIKNQLINPSINRNGNVEFNILNEHKDINQKHLPAIISKNYEESKEDFNKQSFIMNNSHHTDNENNISDSDSNNSNPLLKHEQELNHDNYFEQRRQHANTIDITPVKQMASTAPPQQYLTRIDKDFTDFVKIGQGGFGCVLKARHRIDEQIYAVKIIQLRRLDEQIVVKEAKTMTKIHSKHIVEYKTCWFDSSLGSVKDVVELNEDNESYYEPSMPKSRSYLKISHTSRKGNDSNSMIHLTKILEKEEEDKEEYNNVIFENDINDEKASLEKSKKENAMAKKIFEESFSDEEQHNKLNKKLLLHDFRDDSSIGEKSNISKREIPRYDTYFFIQMEFCDGLSLNQYIETHSASGGLSPIIIFTFTYQLVKSLKKIHNKNIIHRDIKPANIFIYNGNSIKIGDFGLATELNNKSKPCISPGKGKENSKIITNADEACGTPIYLSPEQWDKKPINEKVDIYAMGLVLYEMCACFETFMERRDCLKRLKTNRIICEKVLQEYPIQSQLILKMTEKNPNNRPSAYEILTSYEFKEWENSLDQ